MLDKIIMVKPDEVTLIFTDRVPFRLHASEDVILKLLDEFLAPLTLRHFKCYSEFRRAIIKGSEDTVEIELSNDLVFNEAV